MAEFKDLLGKTIVNIVGLHKHSREIDIYTSTGEHYIMKHYQTCCEDVQVEDVCGEIDDILNSPILQAEKSTSDTNPFDIKKKYQESFTWTFYRIATMKGQVVIRWYGESSGYYSEEVEFDKIS